MREGHIGTSMEVKTICAGMHLKNRQRNFEFLGLNGGLYEVERQSICCLMLTWRPSHEFSPGLSGLSRCNTLSLRHTLGI